MNRLRLFLAVFVGGWVSPVWAAPNSALEIGPAGDYLLKSMLILLGLLAVMIGALKLLRRYGHLKKATGNRIRVIEGISLGGHERAVLVGIDNHEILLGVSQGRVQPLLQINADNGVVTAGNHVGSGEVGENDRPRDNRSAASFANLLQTGPG